MFVKKTWVDRSVEHPGRRKLTDTTTGTETTVDVSREEGAVAATGDAFNATNMNALETRIYTETQAIRSDVDTKIGTLPEDCDTVMEAIEAVTAEDKFDSVPTENSTKFVNSGVVYTAVKDAKDVGAAADATVNALTDRVKILEAYAQGKLYVGESEEAEGTQSVPANSLSRAVLEEYDGKTVVWNQLNGNNQATSSKNGITCTKNTDGTWTVNGTASANTSFAIHIFSSKYVTGHKILVGSDVANNYSGAGVYPNGRFQSMDGMKNAFVNYAFNLVIAVAEGYTANNLTFKPYIIDLTKMFGSGNEPTTTDDPRISAIEAYAEVHPAYNAGELVSVDVVKVVGKKANGTAINEHATFYGQIRQTILNTYPLRSAGSVHDSIEFDGEKWWHVKRVGILHIDETNFSHKYSSYYYLYHYLTGDDAPATENNGYAVASNGFEYKYGYSFNAEFINDTHIIYGSELSSNWETAENLKSYLHDNPYDIVYKLATPVRTDITSLMNWNGVIEVEPGGSIEFVSETIQLPIHNKVSYLLKTTGGDA